MEKARMTPMSEQVLKVYKVFLTHFGRRYRETYSPDMINLLCCGFIAALEIDFEPDFIQAVETAIMAEKELFEGRV